MRSTLRHRLLPFVALSIAPLGLALGSSACDGETAPTEEEVGSLVEEGKADNFLAASASEYWIEGSTTIALDSSWSNKSEAQRLAEVKRLIPFKQVVIGWFLNRYIVDKDPKEADASYGGFKALTKNGSYEDMNIRAESALVWRFDFRQEIAGQVDLIKAIPDAKSQGDGTWKFDLVIGKISTADMQKLDTDREWYRSAPWGSFTPQSVSDDQKEVQPLVIRPQPAEDDAWIDINRLMADDKLTIGIHFGWDYHSAYHEKHSKTVYEWLVNQKAFKSPVAKWEDLRHNAGPLKGTVDFRGRKIAVEVSIFWGRKGDPDTDPDTAKGGKQLELDMLESLEKREVTIFSGHSGPFYGFALANWRMTSEGDLDDSELMDVALNVGNYQIVVAEGCDTYAIGQAFALNPDKPDLIDLDVITTTSFSNASSSGTVTDTLAALLGPARNSKVSAVKYSTLLADMDSNSYWFASMYGVHGIDDNPRVHPFADLAKSCKSCTTNASCGDGMRCVKDKSGKNVCLAECTATIGCQSGHTCRSVATGGYLEARVCAPEGLSCAAVVTPAQPGKLLINEVMFAPKKDYSKDGTTSSTQDEYVELVNAGAAVLDLTGWSIADGHGVRHVFASNTKLPPGGALVVFGGGSPKLVAGTTLVQSASTKALGLNDGGDSVTVSDKDGVIVGRVSWSSGLPSDQSWARKKDLDAAATFSSAPASPGVKLDGSNF